MQLTGRGVVFGTRGISTGVGSKLTLIPAREAMSSCFDCAKVVSSKKARETSNKKALLPKPVSFITLLVNGYASWFSSSENLQKLEMPRLGVRTPASELVGWIAVRPFGTET